MRACSILALAMLAIFSCRAAASPARQIPRYTYVVGCDGIVDKVDTIGGAPVRSTDVGRTLPIEHNQFHGATFDGCLIGSALYVPQESAFYAIVPDRYSDPEHVFAFRFSVPDLTWKKAFAAGEFDGETELALTATGHVRVATSEDWLPALFDPVTFRTFDRSSESSAPLLSIIERSNQTLLLWTPYLNRPSILSAANVGARKIVQLELPAGTDKNSAHLVPGGSLVYVEETTHVPGKHGQGETWQKTGRAQIYDSTSGKRVRDFVDHRIINVPLRGISPSGKAIYGKNQHYFLIDLGQTFPDRKVETATMPRSSSIFFTAY